jgi:hypothetical protein
MRRDERLIHVLDEFLAGAAASAGGWGWKALAIGAPERMHAP